MTNLGEIFESDIVKLFELNKNNLLKVLFSVYKGKLDFNLSNAFYLVKCRYINRILSEIK